MLPDQAHLQRDLDAAPFREGVARRRWQLVGVTWPFVLIGIRARDEREFVLRLECIGYPDQPPTGTLWHTALNTRLAEADWPKGDAVFSSVIRYNWPAIYFPLDRMSRQGHPNWATEHPNLGWKPREGIVQYLAEISRHLNSRGYHG